MNINFRELHHQVAFGKSHGKIIWQPRIDCWYKDKIFANEAFPSPFTGMTMPEMFRELNCSARIYDYNSCFKAIEHPSVTHTEVSLNETDTQITISTPVGNQVAVHRRVSSSRALMYLKREVSTEEELKVATWRAENAAWRWDQAVYDNVTQTWSDLGAPTMYLPRVNIQSLYINKMSTQDAVYAIYDWPDTVEAFFKAQDQCVERLIDVVNESPIDIINFGDNLHCATLPPSLFCKYVLGVYQSRCEKLHKAGKFVHAHWDGDTKLLLPFAKETGLDGIEAITPKPQGDVTLEEIKDALGDKMFLIDGLPAILFDKTFPVSMLEDYTHRLIEMFAPRLILGISDEISSTGDLERIRVVGKIVEDYNNLTGK